MSYYAVSLHTIQNPNEEVDPEFKSRAMFAVETFDDSTIAGTLEGITSLLESHIAFWVNISVIPKGKHIQYVLEATDYKYFGLQELLRKWGKWDPGMTRDFDETFEQNNVYYGFEVLYVENDGEKYINGPN